MNPRETPKDETERHRRILQAVALRDQDNSYPEIAKALGCSVSTAYAYVWAHLDRIDDEATQALVKLRNKELARIERVIVRLWAAIENPDDEIATKAAATFLKGSERRAKLLGLDAPTKVQEVAPDDVDKMTRDEKVAAHRQAIAELEAEGKTEVH